MEETGGMMESLLSGNSGIIALIIGALILFWLTKKVIKLFLILGFIAALAYYYQQYGSPF